MVLAEPNRGPDEEDDGGCCALCRRWIARELASTEACRDLREAASVSSVVCRVLLLSPMAAGWRGAGGVDAERCGGGGEGGRSGEEGLDRDTRCYVDGYFGVTRPYALPRA